VEAVMAAVPAINSEEVETLKRRLQEMEER
jgi:hypothetical protein